MIELNGIKYELKYNLKRIELIEAASKKPLMSMLGSGFLTISDLTACVAYGLRSEGADNYLPTAKGMEVARKKMEEDGGYMILSDAVAEAFERDCPFFLPGRIVEFEYLLSESDEEYQKLAEPYLKDMGFAFFAVNFGYSISDYEQLTPRQRTFIYKAYENKMIADTANIYNAVFTAYYNANRPKNRRPLKLFKKKSKKADQADIEENLNIIREIEQEKGKSWVDLIYKRNGLRKEEKNV